MDPLLVTMSRYLVPQVVKGADCLGRDAARELAFTVGLRGSNVPNLLKAVTPKLSDEDRKVVDNTNKLLAFLLGNLQVGNISFESGNGGGGGGGRVRGSPFRP